MKVAKKTLSYKGINFELNIDVNKLIGDMKERYMAAFAALKSMVKSRERYIKRLHKAIKNRDHQMRMFTVCSSIYEKASKIYNIRIQDFDILSYMYDIEHTNLDRISNYVSSLGSNKVGGWSILRLTRRGYILKSERDGYYYISDSGKQVVESVSTAIQQDMKYYFANKMSKRNTGKQTVKERPLGESKYTEEEIHRRREQYKIFMQPYWDMGKKRLPSDPFIRYSILKKWISDKESAGEKVNPIYNKYMINIQSKMAETNN